MTRTAFLDAPAGLAGDMVLGALVAAGLPREVLETVPEALSLEDVTLHVHDVRRGALACTKVDVRVGGASADEPTFGGGAHEHGVAYAGLRERLQAAAGLPREAVSDAVRIFDHLADAEAAVHGTARDEVHLHEVGAVDALVDVLGACVGLRHLGVRDVRVGPLPWGRGRIDTAHGTLPLPAPAVVHLLAGHPTFPSDAEVEEVTPTGAALVRGLASGHAVPVGFVPRAVGWGAGTREHGPLPNAVRLVLGDVAEDATPTDAVLLETNVDDATGEVVARALEAALEAGALDAWTVPATMKKGRPAFVLAVLARPHDAGALEALLFRETPTLGVRRRAVARRVLPRRQVAVRTPWGEVDVKVREGPDGEEATPEHDDCLRLARAHDVPLRRVLEAARRAYEAGAPS